VHAHIKDLLEAEARRFGMKALPGIS
jgi:hypothetical protein